MAQANPRRPKVREFLDELVQLVRVLPEFEERTWTIYNLEDLDSKRQFVGFPVVGVGYEGAFPTAQGASSAGNYKSAAAVAHQEQCQAMSMLVYRFSIIVGIEYNLVGQADNSDDTKAIATDLLDAIRQVVLGYKGVNTRPWQFEGERPTGSEIEGVIWYGQVWRTTVPVLSQHR